MVYVDYKKLALDRTFNVAGLYKLGLRFFSLFTHIKHSKNILAGAPFTGEQIVDASMFEQPSEQQNLTNAHEQLNTSDIAGTTSSKTQSAKVTPTYRNIEKSPLQHKTATCKSHKTQSKKKKQVDPKHKNASVSSLADSEDSGFVKSGWSTKLMQTAVHRSKQSSHTKSTANVSTEAVSAKQGGKSSKTDAIESKKSSTAKLKQLVESVKATDTSPFIKISEGSLPGLPTAVQDSRSDIHVPDLSQHPITTDINTNEDTSCIIPQSTVEAAAEKGSEPRKSKAYSAFFTALDIQEGESEAQEIIESITPLSQQATRLRALSTPGDTSIHTEIMQEDYFTRVHGMKKPRKSEKPEYSIYFRSRESGSQARTGSDVTMQGRL